MTEIETGDTTENFMWGPGVYEANDDYLPVYAPVGGYIVELRERLVQELLRSPEVYEVDDIIAISQHLETYILNV